MFNVETHGRASLPTVRLNVLYNPLKDIFIWE